MPYLNVLLIALALASSVNAWVAAPRPVVSRNQQNLQGLSMNTETKRWNLNKCAASLFVAISLMNAAPACFADEVSTPTGTVQTTSQQSIQKVPLLTKRTTETQPFADVNRGFKLLRPFGFNEFDGAGGGYVIKFASLFDIDENVVVGNSPASADKTSITDYGSLDSIGEKLAKKRGGKLVSATARETDGVIFYQYEFENPLDTNLPRPKNMKATKGIELYELCVNRGKLWSVQATSNDKLFPGHEQRMRDALASFFPRL